MQELRLVAVSEDGSYAVLVVPGRSGRFALPIDERLRTVARGQFSRLAQYEIEVESPLRPKEIQDRIRAGETAEEIADAAGLPVDRIRRFEGPPLAERARWAQEAQRATVRSRAETGPGSRLGDVVTDRLADVGANLDDVEWDSRKRPDGNWQLQLAYTVAGRLHMAEWVFDVRSKHVTPDDDEAIRLCLDESQWPEPRPAARGGTATVTPIGSRTSALAGHQPDQRGDADRAPGRGIAHPSRQAPGAGTGVPYRQPAAGLRAPGPAETGRPAATAAAAGPVQAVQPGRAVQSGSDGQPGRDDQPGSAAPAKSTLPESAREPAAAAVAAGGGAAVAPVQPEGDDRGPAAPGDDAPAPARPARRTAGGRSRRSSVPSWDEIMFGNSRQPE